MRQGQLLRPITGKRATTAATAIRSSTPLTQQFAKEFDPAKRAELAIKLNDMLVNDVAIIPLINRVHAVR